MNDIAIESFRSIIVLGIIVILCWKGNNNYIKGKSGFSSILTGFALILFASLLDISDNFSGLNRFVMLGDTPVEAFLEKVVGYTGGFFFIALGLLQWLPAISEAERTRISLKKSQKDLAESEKRFRELAFMLPEIVYEMDEKGRVTFANEKAFELTGYSKEDFAKGISALDLFVAEDRERVTKNMRDIMAGAPGEGREYTFLGKDGSTFPVMAFSKPFYAEGEVVGLRGIIVDLRSIKQMEARLLQAQKMEALGTLAGGVAHDFNNILQGISGFVNLALTSNGLTETIKNRLQRIDEICNRAAGLVKGLLAFSRRSEPSFKPIDLNSEIHSALEILERTLPKTVQIQAELDEDALLLKGDSNQILQILINLASNASDALSGKGKIHISTGKFSVTASGEKGSLPPGDYVHLSVSDQGVGISPKDISYIFDPFYTTKGVGKGTGLGLAIVFGLVKSHGGYVTCESQKDIGTTFNIYFPATVEKIEDSPQSHPEPADKSENKLNLLIVDDNHEVIESISESLQAMGHQTILAYSGEEAVRQYQEKFDSIDIVVLDIGMPGMGGLQCLRELRKLNPVCKIIIATGYALPAVPKDNEGRKVDVLINKPYRFAELLAAIRAVNSA